LEAAVLLTAAPSSGKSATRCCALPGETKTAGASEAASLAAEVFQVLLVRSKRRATSLSALALALAAAAARAASAFSVARSAMALGMATTSNFSSGSATPSSAHS
jgi:hypothetical protein